MPRLSEATMLIARRHHRGAVTTEQAVSELIGLGYDPVSISLLLEKPADHDLFSFRTGLRYPGLFE